MSSFGRLFKITTFGESHSDSVGVIIENCPPNITLTEEDLQYHLDRRKPGQSIISTDRKEGDSVKILSGTENNLTLGTPICAIVKNKDHKPGDYNFQKQGIDYIPRPSHADYTYLKKYGIHASSGGGRSSARETIGRVAGGAVALKWLKTEYNIDVIAYVSGVGNIICPDIDNNSITRDIIDLTPVRCPCPDTSSRMINYISELKRGGDSVGGIVSCVCRNVPCGLGEPCFDKIEALLAHAMLSIPATKGFEIGSGFGACMMTGSKHNDIFYANCDELKTKTNNSGGILGGISSGENIEFNVAFKPPATILKPQQTSNISGKNVMLETKGRHDPCVVNRAVPIVESMAALVIMDLLLIQKSRN